MSADRCPVCGAVKTSDWPTWACDRSRSNPCGNAERLAIERAEELDRLKNAEHITAEIESAAGQPALIVSAYDLPIHWTPGDIVRITLETPLTNAGKSESNMKEE